VKEVGHMMSCAKILEDRMKTFNHADCFGQHIAKILEHQAVAL